MFVHVLAAKGPVDLPLRSVIDHLTLNLVTNSIKLENTLTKLKNTLTLA